MAVAVALVSGTAKPQSVKLKATGSGGGGVAAVPKATVIGLLAEGPLKKLMNEAAGADFAALAENANLAISMYANVAGGTPVAVGIGFDASSVYFAVAGNIDAIVELRHVHSMVQ